MNRAVRVIGMLAATIAATGPLQAFAWGGDGHSIIAELAQRRLTPASRQEVERLLGTGVSLASISNWADDYRPLHPETFNLHFVDIPIASDRYDPAKECAATPKGDCLISELARDRLALACPAADETRRMALRMAVHLIGDLHQPFHTVDELQGGNGVKLDVDIRNGKCPKCAPRRTQENLHAIWDSTLVTNTVWNWGAYVTRLEEGWLTTAEARGGDAGTVEDWVLASHRVGAEIWTWTPENHLVGDDYYTKAVPVLDRQLGLGGLRLARWLNDAFSGAPAACPNR